jgi:hypothetical protein
LVPKRSKAEPLLRERWEFPDEVLGGDGSRFFATCQLGRFFTGRGKLAQAEPLITRDRKEMKARAAKTRRSSRGQFLEASGRVAPIDCASGQAGAAKGLGNQRRSWRLASRCVRAAVRFREAVTQAIPLLRKHRFRTPATKEFRTLKSTIGPLAQITL